MSQLRNNQIAALTDIIEYVQKDPSERVDHLVIYGDAAIGKSFLVDKIVSLLLSNYKVYSDEYNNVYDFLDKNIHKKVPYTNKIEHNNFIIMGYKPLVDTDKHTFKNVHLV